MSVQPMTAKMTRQVALWHVVSLALFWIIVKWDSQWNQYIIFLSDEPAPDGANLDRYTRIHPKKNLGSFVGEYEKGGSLPKLRSRRWNSVPPATPPRQMGYLITQSHTTWWHEPLSSHIPLSHPLIFFILPTTSSSSSIIFFIVTHLSTMTTSATAAQPCQPLTLCWLVCYEHDACICTMFIYRSSNDAVSWYHYCRVFGHHLHVTILHALSAPAGERAMHQSESL